MNFITCYFLGKLESIIIKNGQTYEKKIQKNLLFLVTAVLYCHNLNGDHRLPQKHLELSNNKMEKVIIFGGTGFIGLSLAQQLKQRGFQPILVARNENANLEYDFRKWDAVTVGAWAEALDGATAIVNLAGKSVDCIKTPDNCDVILRSRVGATKAIANALHKVSQPPKVWIQMSTAHIYGDPPKQVCTEEATTGYGLAPFVGKAWEAAFIKHKPAGIRGVRLRTSFVIGKNGGALKSLKRIARLGLGGRVGHGRQGISWIHEHDMNEIVIQAILKEQFEGVYIASAPNPVSNAEFMRTLRQKMRVPIGLPAPALLTRLGARFIFKTDPELVLYGRYVKSKRLDEVGFQFKFPELDMALEDLVRKK